MSAVPVRPQRTTTPPHAPVDQWASVFLLDSDVAIEHLRGRPWTGELFCTIVATRGGVCYSPVTAAEIYHGVRPGEEEATARLFASLPCIPVDHGIGEQAGQYLRRYRASHGLALGTP